MRSELIVYTVCWQCFCALLNFNVLKEKQIHLLEMSQLYKLAEVKKHNGRCGAKTWIVIEDSVYDVTDYLQDVRNITQLQMKFK